MNSDTPTIMAVDDTPANLELLAAMLGTQGYQVRCASSGKAALEIAIDEPPDLFLLDIQMPEPDGYELCGRLKSIHHLREIPVIFISALHETIDKVKAFAVGGVDYVTKPFQFDEVRARIETHLTLRRMHRELQQYNDQLQGLVRQQVQAIVDAHMATIFALAKLAESRDDDTGNHIRRVQAYSRVLAVATSRYGLESYIDETYAENLFHTAPLHDIGKVGIPDAILLKPDRLSAKEMEVMRTHTLIGAWTLDEVLRAHPDNLFIKMGRKIAQSHHERWDGSGYPEGLRGEAIPLSARILAVADQYDALRNARPYKPPLDHQTACDIILKGDGRTLPTHFDPRVLRAFKDSLGEFDQVFNGFRDSVAAAS